jgi:pSer/pThr/pTyr-binding forkhead associated (FHA) protein
MPAPPSTDADLAAGARSAPPEEPPAPAAPIPAPAVADVAATMVAPPPMDGGGAEREPTTLMPAWSPPPVAPPAPPSIPQTMAMPTKTQPPAGVAAAGPQGELTIESGPDAGHTHRAGDHALRLGRSPDNDVILRDPATSGHHARLERRGETFWLVDLGSTNGTFVNGEAIQEKQLSHGDRVTLGQNSVHFGVLGA